MRAERKLVFDCAEPQPIMDWSSKRFKLDPAREQREERLSLLRLSRVAREQGEAKHNALSIMNKKLIYRTSLNPRFSVRPDKNKNVEGLLVFILKIQGNLG